MEIKNQRNASLDVLRVLSMFMIVITHCLGHGGIGTALKDTLSLSYFEYIFASSFFQVHVNCFVLVSGYFLCTSTFKWSKVVKLWVTAFFWSVLLYLLTAIFGGEVFPFSIKELVKVCLPFTQQRYWFLTTYLLMYLLCPVCNSAIHAMNKRQHLSAIMTFFAVFIVLQNLTFWREFTLTGSHDPLFFIFLYFVAAYFRRYPPQKKRKWILGYVACMTFVALWRIVDPIITTYIFGYEVGDTAFIGYNSIPVVLGAVCLFLTFAQANIPGVIAKAAVALAPLTFGVYLIHDNNQIRTLLWSILIKPSQFANSPYMIFIVMGISVIVFAVCALMEKGRLELFRVLKMDGLVARFSEKVERMQNTVENKLLNDNNEKTMRLLNYYFGK